MAKKKADAKKETNFDAHKRNLTILSYQKEITSPEIFGYCTADVSGQLLKIVLDTGAQDNYVPDRILQFKSSEIISTQKFLSCPMDKIWNF